MKVRVDELLVQQALAPTRSKARALIMAGQVRSGDRVIDKAGTLLEEGTALEVAAGPQYASRGGYKLAHALERFGIDPTGMVCADFGASTGGFTDVLLQRGASRVYAIDVGYGQFDYGLRVDERVVVMERTNVRHLESLPEPVDLVTIDLSFISLELIFPAVTQVLRSGVGICIALIKPQFEAGKEHVGQGGVVRDPVIHRAVLERVLNAAGENGLLVQNLTVSPIVGPAGNREFLAWFTPETGRAVDVAALIDRTLSLRASGKEAEHDA